MNNKLAIKDPLYGIILFDDFYKKIINNEFFVRLKRIKQLSLANLVYPGATHTRYEHSLGTYSLTQMFLNTYIRPYHSIDEKICRNLQLYALLHDIGHISFSHDSEEVLKILIKNHDLSIKLNKTDIKLTNIKEPIHEYIGRKIINYIIKKLKIKEFDLRANYLDLIKGEIGFDRLDYLIRDAYYTGAAYGVIEIYYLLHNYEYDPKLKTFHIPKTEKISSVIESILLARYLMFKNVYHHPTVTLAASILRKILYLAFDKKLLSLEEMMFAGDEAILWKLANLNDPEIAKGARDLLNRNFKDYYLSIAIELESEKEVMDLVNENINQKNTYLYWSFSKSIKTSEYLEDNEIIDLINNRLKPIVKIYRSKNKK